MLNYLWAGMILLGIFYGTFTGNLEAISNAALESAKEAINLCITMLGVMGVWVGLMKIAEKAGVLQSMTRLLLPFAKFLFPKIPKDSKAMKYICTNMAANILGLGWAATPAGLKAMEELSDLQKQSGKDTHIASDEMCIFLIINISSLQLIPVNMIAYRSQYGSVSPTAIIAPALVATLISTLVAVVFCKVISNSRNKRV
ncbi:MAG: nucleoside recognition protein [Lachnospiraceae bacterium]|nr:nucleoside recognition protein [Lachnospiraceae bacterium]